MIKKLHDLKGKLSDRLKEAKKVVDETHNITPQFYYRLGRVAGIIGSIYLVDRLINEEEEEEKEYYWHIYNKDTGEEWQFPDTKKGLYVLHMLNVLIHAGANLEQLTIAMGDEYNV